MLNTTLKQVINFVEIREWSLFVTKVRSEDIGKIEQNMSSPLHCGREKFEFPPKEATKISCPFPNLDYHGD